MTQDAPPQSTLLQWYRRVLGEPDREIDAYLGFALFFGGVAFAVVALGTLVLAEGFTRPRVFVWREQAITVAMAALPLVFLGVIVLLPVDRRGTLGGLTGAAICGYAIVRFRAYYPWAWNTGSSSHNVAVTVVYGVGVAVLVAATAAALVAYQLARLRHPGPGDIDPPDEDEPDEHYSREEIDRDIEEAMADVDITWGGVDRTETTPLDLNADSVDLDADTSGMQVDVERVSRESVDEQVAGLQALRGGETTQARSTTTVEDQSAKLAEVRERRRADDGTESTGLLARVLRKLGLVE
jgi:hypothetical protein